MYILPKSAFRIIVITFIALLIVCAYNISVCTIVLQRSNLQHAMYLAAMDERQKMLDWKLDEMMKWAKSNWGKEPKGIW